MTALSFGVAAVAAVIFAAAHVVTEVQIHRRDAEYIANDPVELGRTLGRIRGRGFGERENPAVELLTAARRPGRVIRNVLSGSRNRGAGSEHLVPDQAVVVVPVLVEVGALPLLVLPAVLILPEQMIGQPRNPDDAIAGLKEPRAELIGISLLLHGFLDDVVGDVETSCPSGVRKQNRVESVLVRQRGLRRRQIGIRRPSVLAREVPPVGQTLDRVLVPAVGVDVHNPILLS